MAILADLLDIYTVQTLVERRAKDLGITVVFDPNATTASTTTKQITFPSPSLPVTIKQLDRMYGYMIHETGHHSRPEVFTYMEKSGLSNDHAMLAIFNIIEDQAMERMVGSKYIGDAKALGIGMLEHIHMQDKLLSTKPPSFFSDKEQQKCMAVYDIALQSRLDWDKYGIDSLTKYQTVLPEASVNISSNLVKQGFLDRLSNVLTPKESWELSCDIYKYLYPEADSDVMSKLREVPNNIGKGKSADGKDQQASLSKDDKDKLPDGQTIDDQGNLTYSWKDHKRGEHDRNGMPATIDWTGHKPRKDVVLYPLNKIREVPTNIKGGLGKFAGSLIKIDDNTLANKVRIYIQAKKRINPKNEQYKGRLNRRDLVRLAFPAIDKGDWNKRIFNKFNNKAYKDTAISLVIDWSGSMLGRKMLVAAEAACHLNNIFSNILHVPTSVHAFTTTFEDVVIGDIKRFNDKISTNTMLCKFNSFASYTSGNADGDSLLYIYNNILSPRKEQRKIMIVLSDGAPSDAWYTANNDADSVLIEATKSISSRPNTSLIGIGIQTSAVSRYYKNNRIIHSVSDLNKTLFEVLKEVYDQGLYEHNN
jgi:hypothetical protein